MDPLFLNDSILGAFDKLASMRVSKNADEWMQNIVEFLHQAYPWLSDAKIQVNFSRTDPEAGTGIGQIQVNDDVSIPIIIDNFKLSPLDVFWWNGKLHPLTRDSMMEVLHGSTLGKGTDPGSGFASDMALFSRTQPPYDGRYVYASAAGADKTDLAAALLSSFGTEQAVDYALKKSATFKDVLKDWLLVIAAKDAEEKQAAFKPLGSMIPKKKIGEMTGMPAKKRLPSIKTGGIHSVILDGAATPCVVADHVVSFDGTIRPGARGVFELGGDRYLYSDSELFGEEVHLEKKASLGADPHGWGVFMLFKEGHVLATDPVKVVYRARTPDGLDKIGVDILSTRLDIMLSPNVKNFHKMADGSVALSDQWIFKSIGKLASTSEQPLDFEGIISLMPKQAAAPALSVKVEPANIIKVAAFIRPYEGRFFLSNKKNNAFTKVALTVTDDAAKTTVDAILGLNFINDENSYKFAEQADKLTLAKEACAKLLVASRLGLPIPDGPLRTAMFALDAAERDLRQFNNSLLDHQ